MGRRISWRRENIIEGEEIEEGIIRGENRVDGLRIFEDSIAGKFQDNKVFPGFNLNYVCRYFFEQRCKD